MSICIYKSTQFPGHTKPLLSMKQLYVKINKIIHKGFMQMQESGETYLETIYNLKKKNGHVRSIDIARELDYAKPSVSRAVKILKSSGMITVEPGGLIELTAAGKKKAGDIALRHRVITDYLIQTLHIDETLAEKDACRIEHIISEQTFEKMKQFVEKYKKMFDISNRA